MEEQQLKKLLWLPILDRDQIFIKADDKWCKVWWVKKSWEERAQRRLAIVLHHGIESFPPCASHRTLTWTLVCRSHTHYIPILVWWGSWASLIFAPSPTNVCYYTIFHRTHSSWQWSSWSSEKIKCMSKTKIIRRKTKKKKYNVWCKAQKKKKHIRGMQ